MDLIGQPFIDENSDRRLDARIRVDIPVQVEFDSTGDLSQTAAIASQISSRGITILSRQVLPIDAEILLKIPLPNTSYPIQPSARVAWATSTNGSTLHGIKFIHIPKIHQSHLDRFISTQLGQRNHVSERRLKTDIVSELIEFRSRNGKRIVGFHDHLLTTDIFAPFLLIPSPYTETKINSLHIAYYLANNGFNVIRFDATNHVGESEGDVEDYSLPNLRTDILSALDYVQVKSPKAKIGVVAASMAARAAFKAVSEDLRPKVLISLVGVVNMRYTLHMVQNIDLFGTYEKGKIWGVTNVLGFDVKLDRLLGECIKESFDDLSSTKKDLGKAKCPIVFLVGEKDPWVESKEASEAFNVVPQGRREVHSIAAMHRLKENPSEAKRAFKLIVAAAGKHLGFGPQMEEEVVEPKAREIGVQARLERERARHLTTFTDIEEKDFWGDYLRRFHYIYSIADYRELLDTVHEELGSLKNNDLFLDAGCGNGNFGLWLLMKLSDECKNSAGKKLTFHYIAVDIVPDGLGNARALHKNVQLSLKRELPLARDFMAPHYYVVDLNQALPFLDNTFDKICSNLVISYLSDPVSSLRELIRVLKPGGKLVITTLKKDADISQIYRNFVEKAKSEKEISEARNLLSNAGKILVKESEGYFRFFSERELQNVLNQAQPNCIASYRRCFADQAIALTITK